VLCQLCEISGKRLRFSNQLSVAKRILSSTLPSCVSQRPQIVQRFPSDDTVGVFSRPTANTPSTEASYNIRRRDVRSPPFSAILVLINKCAPWTTLMLFPFWVLSLSSRRGLSASHPAPHLSPHSSLRTIYSVLSYVCPCVLSMDLKTKGVSSFIYSTMR